MEFVIAALVIGVVVYFVMQANKAENQRRQENERQAAAELARLKEFQEQEKRAKREKEAKESAEREERQRQARAQLEQQRQDKLNEIRQSLTKFSPDRLRLEYDKRQKAISELKADIRHKEREHDDFCSEHDEVWQLTAADSYHAGEVGRLERQIRELEAELKVIEEAI